MFNLPTLNKLLKTKKTQIIKKKIIAHFLDKRKLIPNKNEEMKKDQPQNKQKYY